MYRVHSSRHGFYAFKIGVSGDNIRSPESCMRGFGGDAAVGAESKTFEKLSINSRDPPLM